MSWRGHSSRSIWRTRSFWIRFRPERPVGLRLCRLLRLRALLAALDWYRRVAVPERTRDGTADSRRLTVWPMALFCPDVPVWGQENREKSPAIHRAIVSTLWHGHPGWPVLGICRIPALSKRSASPLRHGCRPFNRHGCRAIFGNPRPLQYYQYFQKTTNRRADEKLRAALRPNVP